MVAALRSMPTLLAAGLSAGMAHQPQYQALNKAPSLRLGAASAESLGNPIYRHTVSIKHIVQSLNHIRDEEYCSSMSRVAFPSSTKLLGDQNLPSDLSATMEGYPFGTHMVDNSWSPPPTTESTMNPLPEPQANSIRLCPPTQLDSWTVDSADVFVRSGPNGLNRFAPWGPERAKETDPTPASEDE